MLYNSDCGTAFPEAFVENWGMPFLFFDLKIFQHLTV